MSDKDVKEFIEIIDAGLKLAEKRMIQEKALRNEAVVVYSKDKGIQHIPAKEIIAKNIQYQS